MSDVEKRIKQWKARLSDAGTLRSADIHELESHLRDEIDSLKTSGLSGDEAFLLARHRLGDPTALEQEFAKINARSRFGGWIGWMMIGVLLFLFATYFSSTASLAFIWLGFEHGIRNTTNLAVLGGFTRTMVAVSTLLFAVWLCACLWRRRATRPIPRWTVILGTSALAVGVLTFCVLHVFCTALVARYVGARNFGSIAMAGSYADIAWRVLTPVLLMGWLAARHLRDRRRANVDGQTV